MNCAMVSIQTDKEGFRMKKKIFALALSLILAFSCPAAALAASAGVSDFNAVVAAVQADLNNKTNGTAAVSRLTVNLLRSLTERLKNTELGAENVTAAMDKANALLARLYASLGSYAPELLGRTGPAASAQAAVTGRPAPAKENAAPAQATFADLSHLLSKYVFVKIDNADEVAALIAQSCEFNYTVINGENGTIYIRVDVEKNPEIFNYAVFRHLVEDLYAAQGEEMLKNGDGSTDYLMSYEHIAGELALHALIYAASNEILRVTGIKSARLLSLYRSAAQADLNIDEARLPGEIISAFGAVLMNQLSYRLMSMFGLI